MKGVSVPSRRADDSGVVAGATRTVRITSRTFWQWFSGHHIDSVLVLALTLYLTHTVLQWSMTFPYDVMVHEPGKPPRYSGTDVGLIVAAVLGPWGLAQAALVKWYMEMRSKTNGGTHTP